MHEAGAPERATLSVALVVAAKSAQQEKKREDFRFTAEGVTFTNQVLYM